MTQYQKLRAGAIAAGIAIFFLILWLLYGCGDEGNLNIFPNISPNSQTMTTPGGYKCQMPRIYALYSRDWIIFDEKHIRDVVMNWLDIRIETTLLDHPDKVKGRDIAESKLYILHNNYMFPCEADTGMCYGRTNMLSYIEGVIYARWSGNSYPDFQTNPDLVKTKEYFYQLTGVKGWITQGSNYYASDIYPDGMGLLVIQHELEHCLYGSHYGHQGFRSHPSDRMTDNGIHMTVAGPE